MDRIRDSVLGLAIVIVVSGLVVDLLKKSLMKHLVSISMGTEDFKKFMDEVRTVQKDMFNKKPGSIKRARIIVKKLRLQRLHYSFMESAIHDAEKNIPKKDW